MRLIFTELGNAYLHIVELWNELLNPRKSAYRLGIRTVESSSLIENALSSVVIYYRLLSKHVPENNTQSIPSFNKKIMPQDRLAVRPNFYTANIASLFLPTKGGEKETLQIDAYD